MQREGVSSSGSRRTELVQLPCKGEGRGASVAAAGLREGRCRAREIGRRWGGVAAGPVAPPTEGRSEKEEKGHGLAKGAM